MASLISSSDTLYLTGALSDHFDTFSRNIIVYKMPQQLPTDLSSPIMVGYGTDAIVPNFTETEVTGIFPAIRMIKNDQPINSLDEIKATIVGQGKVRIKVKENAMLFIENGPNQKISVDNMLFNVTNEKYTQNYLGLVFYIYHLDAVK